MIGKVLGHFRFRPKTLLSLVHFVSQNARTMDRRWTVPVHERSRRAMLAMPTIQPNCLQQKLPIWLQRQWTDRRTKTRKSFEMFALVNLYTNWSHKFHAKHTNCSKCTRQTTASGIQPKTRPMDQSYLHIGIVLGECSSCLSDKMRK